MAEIEREAMEYDVVIVGAGPAGLSAAIRLKQLNADLEVVVLEKGSEVGAHILSGAVLDPSGLDALIPDWKEKGAPLNVPVREDNFYMLGEAGQLRIPNWPMPPLMNNHGNYIVSMGNVCRWMAEQAEEMGVEIFPGMACSELVYSEEGAVKGVVAGEFGKNADGTPSDAYEPGMELHGKYVFLGEGVRGSLSKEVIAKYDLAKGHEPQKFGLGMKEIWEIDPAKHHEGSVTHTMGWPLGGNAGGGSFIYHLENNQVYVGFVVHLNYKNPHLFPYMEFQRFKHHPMVAELLKGGKRVAYGARAISEGGYQSMPTMVAPGVALLGCSVGMVNVPRIKGNHNAMLSGKAAAEAAFAAIEAGRASDALTSYEEEVRNGPIGQDLKKVRNVKPMWSKWGLTASLMLGGLDMWTNN
ncbi:MAG: NAD(P)/FAD-dependent oxidoreductase, partial [Pseudomonadota bacterium]